MKELFIGFVHSVQVFYKWLVICGTSASQYFTEDLSNWLFFPNIVKILPPENKAPKQTPETEHWRQIMWSLENITHIF